MPGFRIRQGYHGRRCYFTETIDRIKKPTIKRLARRAGVKRATDPLYSQAKRDCFKSHVEELVRGALLFAMHMGRNTVKLEDVLAMMKRRRSGMYGFGWFLESTAFA